MISFRTFYQSTATTLLDVAVSYYGWEIIYRYAIGFLTTYKHQDYSFLDCELFGLLQEMEPIKVVD